MLQDIVEALLLEEKPRGGKYQKKFEYTEKETVPLILDGVKIANIPISELMAKP